MKQAIIGLSFVALAATGFAEEAPAPEPKPPARIFPEISPAQRAERISWFVHDRFGMFIHFGLYAMAARHEWVRHNERIDNGTYDSKYFARFDPDQLDARAWVRAAKGAGMKYVVLTTKHHEGFCNWDTKTVDYKITKTPFGRDLVKEFTEACRAEGLKVGLYYSIIDWHHPDYTIDHTHPLRPLVGSFNSTCAEADRQYAELNKNRDMARYRACMFEQVRELLTNYGKIDIMWVDYTPKGSYGKTWKDFEAVELLKMIRSLQPQVIVNNRLDLHASEDGWDFVTPEQVRARSWPEVCGKRVPWETCQTFSGSWGYHRDEATWKSPYQLIATLIESVSKGGNVILNVGPNGRGLIDARAQDRLAAMGKWMAANARAIRGCSEAPEEFVAPTGTALTYNPTAKRLYIHLLQYPQGKVSVAFWDRLAYAQFLHDGSEIRINPPKKKTRDFELSYGKAEGSLTIPIVKPDVEIPVIECYVKE